ncbi:hypothetical protein AAG570_010864 [Ranatra chinensis]|uniref:Regucalcin n=1 Tax=Ranatra chinensis TaxID=642074 RepID=A0ABD0YIX4_9HEMI
MSVHIEKLPLSQKLQLGEGPHWDANSNLLYFVDIFAGKAFKYDPKSKNISVANLGPGTISFIIPVAGQKDKFLISSNCKLKIVTWDGFNEAAAKIEDLVQLEDETSTNRINDGKCDPKGRLYAGTMGPFDKETNIYTDGEGCLYSYETGKNVKKLVSSIGISNGLAWSPNCKKFYYIDSLKYAVFQYDYSIDDGSISNGREIFNLKKKGVAGLPDGMAIDNDGKLWIACFEGSKVIRIDPDNGDLMYTLEFPSYQITSVAFGGPNLDELYVTSADINQPSDIKKKYPDFGCIFKVTGLGIKGTPMVDFRI